MMNSYHVASTHRQRRVSKKHWRRYLICEALADIETMRKVATFLAAALGTTALFRLRLGRFLRSMRRMPLHELRDASRTAGLRLSWLALPQGRRP